MKFTITGKWLIRQALRGLTQLLWIILLKSIGTRGESLAPCGLHWIARCLGNGMNRLKSTIYAIRRHAQPGGPVELSFFPSLGALCISGGAW
jgi:hypothetical protein